VESGGREEVSLKKYLYVFRPLPRVAEIEHQHGQVPRLEALNEPDDAAGEMEELNGFFRRYALAA
jgi:predicted nucleotidyltransferase